MGAFLIAEAGVNHNGSLEIAKQLIDVAAQAGADAVKFQTFKAELLVTRGAAKAEYQSRTTDAAESQYDMIRKLELSDDDHDVLVAHARVRNIRFLSTPFDQQSLALLTGRLGLSLIKIPSGEITNAPFLLAVARAAKRMILSSGASNLGEVEDALGVLAFGMTCELTAPPGVEVFRRAFASAEGQAALRERVTLLHCTTEYPAPFEDVNLRAIDTLQTAFGLPVGYSDHTAGTHISIAAVARGAVMIEKHFTLDRDMPGPDHKASLEPSDLRQMVSAVRDIERAMGDGIKRPGASEWKNRAVARRSLVALAPISEGEIFNAGNVGCKRPGTGISPFQYWRVLGRRAARSFAEGESLDE